MPRFRPPNVPPLSSGRTRKREGSRWRRASPWYFTTGEREEVSGHDEVRPSAFNGLLGGAALQVAALSIGGLLLTRVS
jgi:hypothetical protein